MADTDTQDSVTIQQLAAQASDERVSEWVTVSQEMIDKFAVKLHRLML